MTGLREATHILGFDGVRPMGLRTTGRASARQLIETANAASNVPRLLQFRLLDFHEYESNDDFLQGASDEVFIQGVGTDSGVILVGPDNKPQPERKVSAPVGSAEDLRAQWRADPYPLLEFDLRPPASWPRSITTTLLIVESDDQKVEESFSKLEAEVHDQIEGKLSVVAMEAGAALGAAVGSIFPGLGTIAGAAIGAIAAAGYEMVIGEIKKGLGDDAFTPINLTLDVTDPANIWKHIDIGVKRSVRVKQYGADYEIYYDWNLAG